MRLYELVDKHEELDEDWRDWVALGSAAAGLGVTGNAIYDKMSQNDAKKMQTPPAITRSVEKPQSTDDQDVAPGYRLFTLPSGKIIQIPEKLTDQQAMKIIQQKHPELLGSVKKQPKQASIGVHVDQKLIDHATNLMAEPSAKMLTNIASKHGIVGQELAQFLAQCAHESNNFNYLKELGDKNYFKQYDIKFNPKKAKELGNTRPGDGARYKGRGYLQLTGRENYRKAGEALGLPLEKHPELVEKPEIAAQTAIWFWKHRVQPNVDNFNNTTMSTKPINSGLKGLEDRKAKFSGLKHVISLAPTPISSQKKG